ncbi:MAG: nucleotidyltransferase domain-containing protein [Candidatus Aenigmarchaeota archaeon]|nr:nucleotidyltransferase domain-containing protein [Candidatus Aenigmarchaeota archaeon]
MNVFPYLYEFVSLLFEVPEARRDVRSVILFGSVAMGEQGKESDIDVFIDTPETRVKAVEMVVKDAEKRFDVIEKKWSVKGRLLPIRTIVGDLTSSRWSAVRSDMISTGIMLFGKFERMPEKLRHYALFSYSLSGLFQRDKMRLLRTLFGYSSKKKDRTYVHEGLLTAIGGAKFYGNALLVPIEKSREVQKLFASSKITPHIREVWIRE